MVILVEVMEVVVEVLVVDERVVVDAVVKVQPTSVKKENNIKSKRNRFIVPHVSFQEDRQGDSCLM